jgi:hypothetical protein
MASQRQVARIVRAAMLFGDDVLNVMGEITVLLAEQALLATAGCPPPHEVSRGSIHQVTCESGAGVGGP